MALLVAASAKAQEAYAVFTDDGTLTFYYDKQKSSRSGTKYGMNSDGLSKPGWYANRLKIPFVCIIGDDEQKDGTVTIKNMETGEQNTIDKSKIFDYVK